MFRPNIIGKEGQSSLVQDHEKEWKLGEYILLIVDHPKCLEK